MLAWSRILIDLAGGNLNFNMRLPPCMVIGTATELKAWRSSAPPPRVFIYYVVLRMENFTTGGSDPPPVQESKCKLLVLLM